MLEVLAGIAIVAVIALATFLGWLVGLAESFAQDSSWEES